MQSSSGPTNDRDAWSAALPPPRDDEPPGLRRDILDEIADHLACAYNRELLRGASSTEAWERVRERFGDPAAVARRLWFEAMKGKIMAQKIVVSTCAVVALASLALVGIVYQRAVLVQRETLRATRAAERRAADAQALQQEMLKQLQAMSKAIQHPRSPDWNPVKFKVVEENESGPPVHQAMVELKPLSIGGESTTRQTNQFGIVDFGLQRPGDYFYTITRSWKVGRWRSEQATLKIEPGTQIEKLVVCPRPLTELAAVRVRCDWPDNLKRAGLALTLDFYRFPTDLSGTQWSFERFPRTDEIYTYGAYGVFNRSIILGPGNRLGEFSGPRGVDWIDPTSDELHCVFLVENVHAASGPNDALSWERGRYSLQCLRVLLPVAPFSIEVEKGEKEVKHFRVLAELYPYSMPLRYQLRSKPPTEMELADPQFGIIGPTTPMAPIRRSLTASRDYWAQIRNLEVRPGQVNEWTIPLPDEVIAKVREQLKKRPSADK